MPVIVAMLRGVNLGAHNRIKMDALRVLYESLKFDNPRTFIHMYQFWVQKRKKSVSPDKT